MKKRLLACLLTLVMLLALLPATALAAGEHPFTDVPQGHWGGETKPTHMSRVFMMTASSHQ